MALGVISTIALALFLSRLVYRPSAAHVAGLSAPLTVMRDREDVPHVWAVSERDLFTAQGYITAQDRLWQMALRRQAARGKLSDWLGDSAADADKLLAGQDFYQGPFPLDARTRQALDAYAAGVNAYLDRARGSPPFEFTLLAARGVSATLDPWTSKDSLALARTITWAQALTAPDAQLEQDLIARLGDERAAGLGEVHPYPVAPSLASARRALQLAALPLFDSSTVYVGYSAPTQPPAWYVMGLHSPSYEAAGATVPGLPGVAAGRGAERAWSMMWSTATLAAGDASAPCSLCIALKDVQQPSHSTHSEPARQLVPYLVALEPQGWLQRRVTPMMARWEYGLEANSAPAAVYEAWVTVLGRRTFADELGDLYTRYAASGGEAAALARLAVEPENLWWDDITTTQRETRDDVMRLAYVEAMDYLGRHYGDLHTIWEWGQMHAATFEHALGDAWPASILLNRGPLFLAGDGFTYPPFPFAAYTTDQLTALSFNPSLAPTLVWRVAQTGEWSFALAGEQSGSLSLSGGRRAAWQAGQYSPLLWTQPDVRDGAQSTHSLLP